MEKASESAGRATGAAWRVSEAAKMSSEAARSAAKAVGWASEAASAWDVMEKNEEQLLCSALLCSFHISPKAPHILLREVTGGF